MIQCQICGESFHQIHWPHLRLHGMTSADYAELFPSFPTMSVQLREKIGIASRGRIPSEETRQKMREARKGYRHSEETKRKISEAHLRSPPSEKRSEAMRRRWADDEQRKTLGKAISKSLKGNPNISGENNHFYGKTHNAETIRKILESEGYKNRDLTKQHEFFNDFLNGPDHPMKNPKIVNRVLATKRRKYDGKTCSPEGFARRRANSNPSRPVRLVADYLASMGLKQGEDRRKSDGLAFPVLGTGDFFVCVIQSGYEMDIVFPECKVDVEVDGDYWHDPIKFPKVAERDKRRNKDLEEKQWTVIRIPEHDVHANLSHQGESILEAIALDDNGELGRLRC